MGLKAVKPVGDPARKIKILLSGEAGAGKTWASLDFPKPYYIDVEGSAKLPHYAERLASSEGAYFGVDQGSNDFDTVNREIQELATTDHDYKTVVLDSFTRLYNNCAAEAEKAVGNDYGKDRKEANKPARKFVNWIHKLDTNLVVICHSKKIFFSDEKEKKEKYNTTYDGFDKLDYELDLWLEILMGKGNQRKALVRKSRFPQFTLGSEFPWSFSDFSKRFGGDVFAKATAFVPATQASIGEFETLFPKTGLNNEWREKMLTANKAASLEEVSETKIREYIEQFKKKIA